MICDPCRHYIGQLGETTQALAHHHDDGPPPPALNALLAAFRGDR